MASYTIAVTPSPTTGKVTATSSDGHTLTTSMPLLDGARYWQQAGAPSTATIVTAWSTGTAPYSLRSTIGHAAKLAVKGDHFRPYAGNPDDSFPKGA
jgi:hypothetical protein